jgi:hypothetical protein
MLRCHNSSASKNEEALFIILYRVWCAGRLQEAPSVPLHVCSLILGVEVLWGAAAAMKGVQARRACAGDNPPPFQPPCGFVWAPFYLYLIFIRYVFCTWLIGFMLLDCVPCLICIVGCCPWGSSLLRPVPPEATVAALNIEPWCNINTLFSRSLRFWRAQYIGGMN